MTKPDDTPQNPAQAERFAVKTNCVFNEHRQLVVRARSRSTACRISNALWSFQANNPVLLQFTAHGKQVVNPKGEVIATAKQDDTAAHIADALSRYPINDKGR